MPKVKHNDTVKVHYTGRLENDEVFDSSLNREPLEFKVGAGMMIPGFEKGVMDMELNEKKTIHIPANEAYGSVREELLQDVPKSMIQGDAEPAVGMSLMATLPNGEVQQFVITEVTDETIKVDGNHPLAGKDLIFDIEIVEIN